MCSSSLLLLLLLLHRHCSDQPVVSIFKQNNTPGGRDPGNLRRGLDSPFTLEVERLETPLIINVEARMEEAQQRLQTSRFLWGGGKDFF